MSTSDGISTEDWNAVHELVLNIVNAEAEAEENIFTNQLLQFLDELEENMVSCQAFLRLALIMFRM